MVAEHEQYGEKTLQEMPWISSYFPCKFKAVEGPRCRPDGPTSIGESLLVTVDYYSRWIEVDVVRNTASSVIIRCLENHFTRHGIPETLRTDNGSDLVSREIEEFFGGARNQTQEDYFTEAETEYSSYLRQCVRHGLKENRGNKNYRSVFLHTSQHQHHDWCQPCRAIVWTQNPNQDARVLRR